MVGGPSAAGLRSLAQTMPPDGPTSAARMQSSADEKAQISDVTPAKSRMHQLSAFPIVGSSIGSSASEITRILRHICHLRATKFGARASGGARSVLRLDGGDQQDG